MSALAGLLGVVVTLAGWASPAYRRLAATAREADERAEVPLVPVGA